MPVLRGIKNFFIFPFAKEKKRSLDCYMRIEILSRKTIIYIPLFGRLMTVSDRILMVFNDDFGSCGDFDFGCG